MTTDFFFSSSRMLHSPLGERVGDRVDGWRLVLSLVQRSSTVSNHISRYGKEVVYIEINDYN